MAIKTKRATVAATEKDSNVSAANTKQRRQQKIINDYKRQQHWLLWAGIVLLFLVLFLLVTVGYAYNWGNTSARRDTLKGPNTRVAAAADAGGESVDNTGNNQPGTSGVTTSTTDKTSAGLTTNPSSNTTVKETSTTSTSHTTQSTTNTIASIPGDASGPSPSVSTADDNLLRLAASTDNGDNIILTLDQANDLGVMASCRTELLLVKVCTFSSGGHVLTTRSLLTNNVITSITRNF